MSPRDATLLARWPEHLIDRIASRNFVLVIGAGASRNCSNAAGQTPPTWEQLLTDLVKTYTRGRDTKEAHRLIGQKDFLTCAQLVRVRAKAVGKEQDFLKTIAELTDGGKNSGDQYQPSALHEVLLRLGPEILITTNYDRILERATISGYNVHVYDSTTLASDLRAGNPVLVKIHGSVDSTPKMILTQADYSRLRRSGAHVLEVVQALFLTRTVLFIGYSFSDPDIHLLLENILGAREDVDAHYLLTSRAIPDYIKDIYSFSYGTTTVTFADGAFDEMTRMLRLLAEAVESRRTPV